MSRQVWKFTVPVNGGSHPVDMPGGSRIVYVDSPAADVVTFWAEVDTEAEIETSYFQVFGTGHEIPETFEYVGTRVSVFNLVWHLYRGTVEPEQPDPVDEPATLV